HWRRTEETIETNPKYSVSRISFLDNETGLICYADVKEFKDYPAAEWTVYFKNIGTAAIPVIENIQALNTGIPCPYISSETGDRQQPEIYYSKGSQSGIADFLYKKDVLDTNAGLRYACTTGYSSNDYLPFFNMKKGNEGLIVAIGWTGKWACSFTPFHGGDTVRIEAGLVKTHLKLFPGEEIRTPKMLLFFWKNDMDHAYNMFRRFMLNFHTPQQNGKPITMPISSCTWGGMKEKSHLDLIKIIRDQKLGYDCYWIDAGWFGKKHETTEYQHMVTNDWSNYVGDWNINPAVLPNGFKPVTAAAHDAGMQVLLWFEPERAITGTALTKGHPEFFLKIPGDSNEDLNLGNPEALKYITDYIADFITKNGIDIYRQDCNFDLAPYWTYHDQEDRIGMTEIKYVTGLYQFWDDLRRRHPGMFIDNCASGGRRIDLESLDRSLTMSRTDYCCVPAVDPIGGQTHNYGLMHWVPLTATINYTRPGNTYSFRSDMSAGIQFSLFDSHGTEKDGISHVPAGYPFGWHRKMMADFKRGRPYFYGDYYPLTNISVSAIDWTAYQLDRPDLKEGMVLVFKRQESPFTEARFILKGIDEKAEYQFENADSNKKISVDGKTLVRKGFTIKIENARESQLWFYKEIK
ncbi:MAG TPA: glycoside hydrolase family 36 protein, partial [Puia sp.]|nr:glycoside hydrolase family 36 protein [Puia sp.]